MRTAALGIAVLVASFASGCGQYSAQIRRLESADAAEDVSSAIKRGDRRFVGIMGIGLSVPGVKSCHTKYQKTNGARVIKNTSDAIESEEHMRLQRAAYQYALKYNTELLRRMSAGK